MLCIALHIFVRLFSPALVDIVLVLAPWAAKGGVGPAAQEHLLAVLAQAQRLVTVHQHETEHHVLIKKLYETYAMGKLEEKRFELLCAEYEKEQAELEQLLASEQAQLDQFLEDTDRASHFLALAQKYTDFTELTAPMIHEFVEKILVHAPDRSTGERVQEICIYLNFIGKFEVPMPEPTEEELAAEEKCRQIWRSRSRRKAGSAKL